MRATSPKRLVVLVGALLLVCAVLAPGRAQAGPIVVYDLVSDHCSGGCGTPPFGTVTLEQLATSVKVTVSIDDPGESAAKFVKTGAGAGQDFLFNATGVTLADITVDPHTPTLAASSGLFHADGTGDWNFAIGCPGCKNGAAGGFSQDIVFYVANATIADLIVGNGTYVFAADILGASGNTGPVAARVPDGGATLMLLGVSLVALGALRRKLRT